MSHDGFRLIHFLDLSLRFVLGYLSAFPLKTEPLDARGVAACFLMITYYITKKCRRLCFKASEKKIINLPLYSCATLLKQVLAYYCF